MPPSAPKKRVVVVGGGVAGSLVAKLLQEAADVTLIDPKDYCEVPYAALRCLVEPSVAERSLISHSSYMTMSKLLMCLATEANRSEVAVDSGERVPFDFRSFAPAARTSGPRLSRNAWKSIRRVLLIILLNLQIQHLALTLFFSLLFNFFFVGSLGPREMHLSSLLRLFAFQITICMCVLDIEKFWLDWSFEQAL